MSRHTFMCRPPDPPAPPRWMPCPYGLSEEFRPPCWLEHVLGCLEHSFGVLAARHARCTAQRTRPTS
eukprot:3364546-Pyramimonas_sp.AAC.1